MPIQLKTTYIYIFTLIVTFSIYGWWVFGVLGIEYFTGADALVRIGRAIGLLIIGGYAFEILTIFLASIFSATVLKNTKDDFMVDERDKEILHKSMHLSHLVLCTGLFLAVGALAMGWSAFWVFHLMVLAFALSVVMELGTKLFLYKQGV